MSDRLLTTVRAAAPEDEDAVRALLEHEDLERGFEPSQFLVAVGNGPQLQAARLPVADDGGCCILGCARLREREDCLELSSVAVRPCCRGEGIGRALVDAALDGVEEPVHALCLEPGFFEQRGFDATDSVPASLAEKSAGICEGREIVSMAWEPEA